MPIITYLHVAPLRRVPLLRPEWASLGTTAVVKERKWQGLTGAHKFRCQLLCRNLRLFARLRRRKAIGSPTHSLLWTDALLLFLNSIAPRVAPVVGTALSLPVPSLSVILRFSMLASPHSTDHALVWALCQVAPLAMPILTNASGDIRFGLSVIPTTLTQVVRKPFPNSYRGQVRCRQDSHSSTGLCYHRAAKIFDGEGKEVCYSPCMSPVTSLIFRLIWARRKGQLK